jgi:hypothetical protein
MNSSSIMRYSLGKTGLDYVRSQLLLGGPLTEVTTDCLLEGDAWEYSLRSSGERESAAFQSGGHFNAEESGAIASAYCEFFSDYLVKSPPSILLFENQLFRLTDPCMRGRVTACEYRE